MCSGDPNNDTDADDPNNGMDVDEPDPDVEEDVEEDAVEDAVEDDADGEDGPDCTEDDECEDGQICQDETCVEGCRDNDGCEDGESCQDNQCVGAPCDGDESCDDGQICEEGACIAGCRADSECDDDTICQDNQCVEGCREDSACPDAQYCDTDALSCEDGCRAGGCPEGEVCELDTRTCQVVPCAGDEECDDGQICEEGLCVEGCRDDTQCPGDAICQDNQCIGGCREDAQCEGDEICLDAQCVTGCRADSACDGETICLGNQCVEGCRNDGGCALGRICQAEQCVDGCRNDNNCPGETICIDGECIGGCRTDTDCDPGFECFNAQCREIVCNIDADCPLGTFCNPEQSCVDGCRADVECGSGEICQDNQCVEGCRQDDQCEPNQFCDVDGEQTCLTGCRIDPDNCPGDQECDQGTRQCLPPACDNDLDCPNDAFCGDEGRCQEGCRSDDACPDGQICDLDARQCQDGCREDDGCQRNEYCNVPQGEQAGQCDQGCRLRDCPGGQVCDLDTRQCQGAQGCGGDDECGDDEICQGDVCVVGCRLNGDCPGDQVCDPQELFCRPGCQQDDECTSGEYCAIQELRCVAGCRTDDDCFAGFACIEAFNEELGLLRQTCEPAGCQQDTDCDDGFYCEPEENQCAQGCRLNVPGQCPGGEVCNPNTRICGPVPCQNDNQCDNGFFCDDQQGICLAGCRGDADCPANEICNDEFNQCVTGCRGDDNCAADLFCELPRGDELGQCAVGCRVDQCPEGTACDTVNRRCRVGTCQDDDDCPAEDYCRDQVECEPGCRNDSNCVEGQICIDDLRFCSPGCRQDNDDDDVCPGAQSVAVDYNDVVLIEGRRICTEDEDHVAIELEQGDQFQAVMTLGEGAGALKMDLIGPDCGDVVAVSELLAEETVQFSVEVSGVYTIRVRGRSAFDSNDYDLAITRLREPCFQEPTEPNNNLEQATFINLPRGFLYEDDGLGMCDGDEDWFSVDVRQPGDAISATLIQNDEQVPLKVEILFAGGVIVLAETEEDIARKTVQTEALTQTGRYYIRVSPTGPIPEGPGVRYNFQAVVSEAGGCVEDFLEPNDNDNEASLVTAGEFDARMCQDRQDEDWYRVVLLAGDTFNMTLTYDHLLVDPDSQLPVTIYGPGGLNDIRDFTMAEGDVDTLVLNPDGIRVSPDDAGEWLIQVQTGAGEGQLDYLMELTVEAPNCADEVEEVPNESCEDAIRIGQGDRLQGFVCGPTGDEDWFVIEDIQGQSLTALLEHFHFDGNLEMELYDTQTDALLGFSYNAGPNFEVVSVDPEHQGDVCIRVFARDVSTQNRYRLLPDFN